MAPPDRTEYFKEYRKKNKEHLATRARAWKKETGYPFGGKFKKNKEKHLEYRRKYYLKRKLVCIDALGGRCKDCGLDDVRVLTFDHIHGNRGQYNYSNNPKGTRRGDAPVDAVYKLLIKKEVEKMKKVFQLLCANCHMIKTYRTAWHKHSEGKEST